MNERPGAESLPHLTVADLCDALASGSLASRIEKGDYVLLPRDLRDLAEKRICEAAPQEPVYHHAAYYHYYAG